MSLPIDRVDKGTSNVSLPDKCGSFDVLCCNLVVEIGVSKFSSLWCIVVIGTSVDIVIDENTEHDKHDDQQPPVQCIKWARLWRLPIWTPGRTRTCRLSIVHHLSDRLETCPIG